MQKGGKSNLVSRLHAGKTQFVQSTELIHSAIYPMKTTTYTRGLTALITLLITLIFSINANAQNDGPRNPGVGTEEVNQIMASCPYQDGQPRILWRIANCDTKKSQASKEAITDAIAVLTGQSPERPQNSAKQCRRMAEQAQEKVNLRKGGEFQEWAQEDLEALTEGAEALEGWRPAIQDQRPAPAGTRQGYAPPPPDTQTNVQVSVTKDVRPTTPARNPNDPLNSPAEKREAANRPMRMTRP